MSAKTCQRGHDWLKTRKKNTGNGGFCCSECQKYRWAGNDILLCDFIGCKNPMKNKETGFCCTHLSRLNKHGSADVVLKAPNGSGHTNKNGYREIWKDGVKFLEHRWVMQNNLGRELSRHENVHHINGIRHDNDIDNLELWSTSQPSGQRVEDKIDWAIKFLEEYNITIYD